MSFFFISLLHLKRWRHWGMTLMKTSCGLFKEPEAAEDEDEYEYATQLRKKLARVKLSASERSGSGLDDKDRKKLATIRHIAKTETSKALDSTTPRSVGELGKIRRLMKEYRERRLLRRTLATSSVKAGNTSSQSHSSRSDSSQSTAQESMPLPEVSLQRASKPNPEPTKNKAEPEKTKSKSEGHDLYGARFAPARVHSAVNASPACVQSTAGSNISIAAVVESDDEDEEEQTNGAPARVSQPRLKVISSETTLRL